MYSFFNLLSYSIIQHQKIHKTRFLAKHRIIHDPFLDEFLYTLIYGADHIQRGRFPESWQHVFKSSLAANRFCSSATLEEKLYFLTLLGVDWFVVCANRLIAAKSIKSALSKFKQHKNLAALEEMVEKEIFVLSAEKFADGLGLMASVEHQKAYSYNMALSKVGYSLRKWNKNVNHKVARDIEERREYQDSVVDYTMGCALNFMTIETNYSMSASDMLILLHLYKHRHAHVLSNKIYEYFIGILTKTDIGNALRRMVDVDFIRLSLINKPNSYMITALGIHKINQFISKSLLTNF